MNTLHGTPEEKLAQIARMTNLELYLELFEGVFQGGPPPGADAAWERAEISAQLKRRLKRVGFLPEDPPAAS